MPSLPQQHFFQKQVHMKEWKDSMSGKNEDFAINLLTTLMGYEHGKDFVRQYPVGCRFVIDFAFVNEQVAIEIDGMSHSTKKQRLLDKQRDKFLVENNWVPIRIRDSELKIPSKMRFYKNLIRAVVDERREQWEVGSLYAVEIPDFNKKDYE